MGALVQIQRESILAFFDGVHHTEGQILRFGHVFHVVRCGDDPRLRTTRAKMTT